MKEDEADLVENAPQPSTPLGLDEPKNVDYGALPAARPGESLADEWNTYRREVGRLLAEGQERRYVLIKGQEIIGIYETWKQARGEGLKRYQSEPFFVHEIRVHEPYFRARGLNF
jgi:hypothetical protein